VLIPRNTGESLNGTQTFPTDESCTKRHRFSFHLLPSIRMYETAEAKLYGGGQDILKTCLFELIETTGSMWAIVVKFKFVMKTHQWQKQGSEEA
jgi:hypothetical protein